MDRKITKFKMKHHLVDNENRILYCYVAKNACSTLKYNFLKKKLNSLGKIYEERELNKNIHIIAGDNSLLNGNYDDLETYYSFIVVREPAKRLVSSFLDKFVQCQNPPQYAKKLVSEYSDVSNIYEFSFEEFINALIKAPVETLNEHWAPQYIHLKEELIYDIIPIENVRKHHKLNEIYDSLSSNARNHSIIYSNYSYRFNNVTVAELRKLYSDNGSFPEWEQFCTTNILNSIKIAFQPDFDLYNLTKHQKLDPSERSFAVYDLRGFNTSDFVQKMSSKHDLSVIVPIYNVQKFLGACLLSLLNQTNQNFELVLVDDGSYDQSVAIAKQFVPYFRDVKLLRQDNRGLSGARNSGIDFSTSKFITFIDSDDFVSENYVDKLLDAQFSTEADIVSAKFLNIDETGLEIHKKDNFSFKYIINNDVASQVLGVRQPSIACARLYKRSFFYGQKAIRFRYFVPHEDWFFTYKALLLCNKHIELDEPLYFWRQRSGSISKSITKAHVDVLDLLRLDTLEYLKNIGADQELFAMSSRRNLQLLANLNHKAIASSKDLNIYFMDKIKDNFEDYFKEYEICQNSDYPAKNVVNKIKPILDQIENIENNNKTSILEVDVVLFPLRAYHLDECLLIVNQLKKLGKTSLIVEVESYKEISGEVIENANKKGVKIFSLRELSEFRLGIKSILMFNDWDPVMRLIARYCHFQDIESIGYVEGIQDYLDIDTGKKRFPYLRSKNVIVPGYFDKKYFLSTGQKVHVGEMVRVRDLWHLQNKSRKNQKRNVLINSNFSYGVLEECRDSWVETAVKIVIKNGYNPLISKHPFDTGETFPQYVTSLSFYEAIKQCDLSIQRFASGILESLAMGCPVVYYNPHCEKVDKFKNPCGAFLKADDGNILDDIIMEKKFFWDEKKSFEFLKLHTNLKPHIQAGERVASCLVDIINKKTFDFGFPLYVKHYLLEKGFEDLRKFSVKLGPFYNRKNSCDSICYSTFAKGNELFREKSFAKAFKNYMDSVRSNPSSFLYKISALNALYNAKRNGQICDTQSKMDLMQLISEDIYR